MRPEITPAEADAADMLALSNGEDAALDRLMLRWQGPLKGFLLRFSQNSFDTEDLAQETFVRVYQNRNRFKPGATFSTWLFAIACNLARDRLRRQKVRFAESLDAVPEPAGTDTPKTLGDKAERVAAVKQAIADLPADLRAALLLSEYEEKSQQEIASILKTTTKAVESRLYRARNQLRAALANWLQ